MTGGTTKKRKRASLTQMADAAFEEAMDLRRRNDDLGRQGVPGYPRPSDLQKAATFMDISDFLGAVRSLDSATKDAIRKQIAQANSAASEADAAARDAAGQDRQENGEG